MCRRNATLLCLIYLRVNTWTSNEVIEKMWCVSKIQSLERENRIPFCLNNNSSGAFGVWLEKWWRYIVNPTNLSQNMNIVLLTVAGVVSNNMSQPLVIARSIYELKKRWAVIVKKIFYIEFQRILCELVRLPGPISIPNNVTDNHSINVTHQQTVFYSYIMKRNIVKDNHTI